MDALIRTQQLSRQYGDLCAVEGVDLALYPGEIVALLGPNGAGKSTTLRMLSGCLAPSRGSIHVKGFDLQHSPMAAKAAIGYLPEHPPLYRELRVDEYLDFCASLRGLTRDRISDQRERVKAHCGLEAYGKRLIGNLSKGYQQRTGIAQALIHDPEIIILDEPSSGLDPNQIAEIRALIRSLGDSHGIILSTHILAEAEAVCDRVVILHQGRLVFSEQLHKLDEADDRLFRIALGKPPEMARLTALVEVGAAAALGAGRFELQLAKDHTPEQLAKKLVMHDWELRELVPCRRNLEQIFARLTTADPEQSAA